MIISTIPTGTKYESITEAGLEHPPVLDPEQVSVPDVGG
jgi:hypothetical protein